jgi:glycosyltransferase involved in cell wall biosynthesis
VRVLLLTHHGPDHPSARQWFHQMHALLRSQGVDADLNHLDSEAYDVVVVHGNSRDLIRRASAHSPNAHIGVFHPGLTPPSDVVGAIDFFIVTSFLWREMLLPFGRRLYHHFDYEDPSDKPVKEHTATQGLILGYHGNELHYDQHFFPHLARALQRLAEECEFTLKVVIANPSRQPRIAGVQTVFVEWQLNTYLMEIQSFDIGLCPAFSDWSEFGQPFTFVRNPNRVNTMLFYGIPSVTSPIPQCCQALCHDATTLFAVSEHGWYDAIRRLIIDPALRNRIGHAGRAMVERRFSSSVAGVAFRSILEQELSSPPFDKNPSLLREDTLGPPWWKRLFLRCLRS